jgi:WD40 repeat protein
VEDRPSSCVVVTMLRGPGAVVGPVTALGLRADGKVVFAGVGSTLSAYDVASGVLLRQAQLFFCGEVIHGIVVSPRTGNLLIHAGKRFMVLGPRPEDPWGSSSNVNAAELGAAAAQQTPTPPRVAASPAAGFERAGKVICATFLAPAGALAVRLGVGDDVVVLGLFHNAVELWCPRTIDSKQSTGAGCLNNRLELVGSCRCPVQCLVYSMDIISSAVAARAGSDGCAAAPSCQVASGTVFSEIVLWRTNFTSGVGVVSHRLLGHQGVIFKARWSSDGRQIASVSDDRTLRLWQQQQPPVTTAAASVVAGRPSKTLCDDEHTEAGSPEFVLAFSSFGHRARVWDVHYLVGGHLVTISEDSTAKIWDSDGGCLGTVHGHAPKNVWSVAVAQVSAARVPSSIVATGGADGSVKAWTLQHLRQMSCKVLNSTSAPPGTGVSAKGIAHDTAPATAQVHASSSGQPATIRDVTIALCADGTPRVGALLYAISVPSRLTAIDRRSASAAHVLYTGPEDQHFTKVCAGARHTVVGTAAGDVLVFPAATADTRTTQPAVCHRLHDSRVRHLSCTTVVGADESVTCEVFVSCDARRAAVWEIAQREDTDAVSVTCIRTADILTKRGDAGIICATVCMRDLTMRSELVLVLGDCYGHLHTLSFRPPNGSEHTHKYYRLASAHGHHPAAFVRHLAHPSRMGAAGELVSAGHDGWVHFYDLEAGADGTVRPVKRHSFSTAGVAQVERVLWLKGRQVCVAGFKASDFVVVDLHSNCRVAHALCGGWKRPWDLFLDDANDVRSLCLVCVGSPAHAEEADDARRRERGPRTAVQLFTNPPAATPFARSMGCAFHGQLVNWVQWGPAHASSEQYPCVTCSEDGTIKFTQFSLVENAFVSTTSPATQTVVCHGGAVRTFVYDYDTEVLFSAGARGQFCLTRVRDDGVGELRPAFCDELWLQTPDASSSSELNQRCRAMAFADMDGTATVFAGDSAGCLRCFQLTSWKIHLAAVLPCFHPAPVLSVAFAKVGGLNVVLTGASNGCLALHDFSLLRVPRALWSESPHSMGLNSVACHVLSDDRLCVATGGDDQLVCLFLFRVAADALVLESKWESNICTAASIARVVFSFPYLVVSGAENRVFVFLVPSSATASNPLDSTVFACATQVFDVQGVHAVQDAKGVVRIAVAGQGLEVVTVAGGALQDVSVFETKAN